MNQNRTYSTSNNLNRRLFIEKDFSFSRNIHNFVKEDHSPTSTNDSNSPRDHSNICNDSCKKQNK